jgi:hypothetical protein
MFYSRKLFSFLLFFLIFSAESHGKETVYFARRIPVNPPPELLLPISPQTDLQEMYKLYATTLWDKGDYIYSGPWIFSRLSAEGEREKGKLPKETRPIDIVKMVTQRVKTSSMLVAVISGKSYGTISEIGFAVRMGDIPVYVFPDPSLTQEEIQDLWFVFHMAAMTSHLWKEEHFKMSSLFPQQTTLKGYHAFLETLKPSFL